MEEFGPLRVVHVIRSLSAAAGGPPVVVSRLACAQKNMGHDVVLVAERPAPGQTDVPVSLGVAVRMAPAATVRDLVVRGDSRRSLETAFQGCDIVHLHGTWDLVLRIAASVCERIGIRYVVTPHGMLDPWCLAQKRWKKRVALWLGGRRFLKRAAAVHVLNADEARFIGLLGISTPPTVIPNGIDLDGGLDGVFRTHYPALTDLPYILFLGRLHPIKGLDLLVEAFAILAARRQEVQLVIAGPDDGERNRLTEQASRLGVGGRTHFVGPLYGEMKLAVLRGAVCFCLPSRHEGFSMAILEAVASRLPVIISDRCHFPEIAAAGGGFVVSLDVQKLADALEQVLAAPVAARRMGEAGRRLVEQHYTWPRIAEKTIGMYQQVLAYGSTASGGDRLGENLD